MLLTQTSTLLSYSASSLSPDCHHLLFLKALNFVVITLVESCWRRGVVPGSILPARARRIQRFVLRSVGKVTAWSSWLGPVQLITRGPRARALAPHSIESRLTALSKKSWGCREGRISDVGCRTHRQFGLSKNLPGERPAFGVLVHGFLKKSLSVQVYLHI